jgi:hypothetical protein
MAEPQQTVLTQPLGNVKLATKGNMASTKYMETTEQEVTVSIEESDDR